MGVTNYLLSGMILQATIYKICCSSKYHVSWKILILWGWDCNHESGPSMKGMALKHRKGFFISRCNLLFLYIRAPPVI